MFEERKPRGGEDAKEEEEAAKEEEEAAAKEEDAEEEINGTSKLFFTSKFGRKMSFEVSVCEENVRFSSMPAAASSRDRWLLSISS